MLHICMKKMTNITEERARKHGIVYKQGFLLRSWWSRIKTLKTCWYSKAEYEQISFKELLLYYPLLCSQ